MPSGKTKCLLQIDKYNSEQNFDKIYLFSEKNIALKTYFLFMYVRDLLLLERQTTCVQIQRDQKKFWDIKIFVIWIAYPWEYNRLEYRYRYIKLLVHSILFPTHLVLILQKKPNSNWNNFFVFESIAACFSHGESQTHLYCPGNCPKNRGAHQRGKAVTGSQAVCRLEYNGVVM